MSVCTKSALLIQILFFLSSCSLIGGLGFGSKDECADGACETPQILDNPVLNKRWYCYGVAADRSWDCVSQPQPEKIAIIIPTPVKSQALPPAGKEKTTRPLLVPQVHLPDVIDTETPEDPDEGASATRSGQRTHSH